MLRFTVVSTDLGWIGIAGTDAGLVFLTLPKSSEEGAFAEVSCRAPGAVKDASRFGDLPFRLKQYFSGENINWDDKLDLSGATPFDREVWQAARTIPYGETRSYAWVAREIGKPRAFRAVGRALSLNALPIIVPCHRVIASDGNLRGFGGGLALKRRLLDLEAIR